MLLRCNFWFKFRASRGKNDNSHIKKVNDPAAAILVILFSLYLDLYIARAYSAENAEHVLINLGLNKFYLYFILDCFSTSDRLYLKSVESREKFLFIDEKKFVVYRFMDIIIL